MMFLDPAVAAPARPALGVAVAVATTTRWPSVLGVARSRTLHVRYIQCSKHTRRSTKKLFPRCVVDLDAVVEEDQRFSAPILKPFSGLETVESKA